MVKRAMGLEFIGRPADKLRARSVHRSDEDEGEVFGLTTLQLHGAILSDEGGIGDGRARRQHLCSTDDDTGIRLSDYVGEYISHFVHRLFPVNRRVDQYMIEKQAFASLLFVPRKGLRGVRLIELRISAEPSHEGGFVVGSAAHKAIGKPGPCGNRVARLKQFLPGVTCSKELVSTNAELIYGRENICGLRIV